MTIHLGRYFGIQLRRWHATDETPAYLYGVIWYPRGRRELGYLYPSIRWF